MPEPSSQDIVLSRLAQLQEELEKSLPSYKDSLRTIHTILRQDEDLVHVLSDEQIGIVLSALSKNKGIVIAETVAKKVKAAGKKVTIDLGDL